MSDSNQFYVYEHWRSDTGLPFYVGKGKGKRADARFPSVRGRYYNNVAAKLNRVGATIEVRKVFTHLNEETAFLLERTQIAYWRARGIKLVNITIGGDGAAGYRFTPEQRANSKTAAIARSKRPEYIANLSVGVKTAQQRPSVKAKLIALHIDPEIRAKRSKGLLRTWADPVARAKRLEIWADPDYKSRHSAATKAGMASPECKIKLRVAVKKNGSIERLAKCSKKAENRIARAVSMKNARKDPTSALTSALMRPEIRAKRTAALKAAYQDPILRKKIGAAVKEARSSPEARASMRAAAKLAYANPEVRARHKLAVKAAWERRKQRQFVQPIHNGAKNAPQ